MDEIRFEEGHYYRGGHYRTGHCRGIVATSKTSWKRTGDPGIVLTPINSKGMPAVNCYVTVPASQLEGFIQILRSKAAEVQPQVKTEEVSVKSLMDKYDPWGEHELYERLIWKEEVMAGNTQRGYWDWVVAKLEQENERTEG